MFGQFLVRRGLLRPAQLLEALERQQSAKLSIGRLALQEGILPIEQVLEILAHQQELGAERKSFGELAIELGHLDAGQRDDLLKRQQRSTAPLAQVIVELGLLDFDRVKAALGEFLKEK